MPYMWEENLKSMVLVSVCFCNKLPHSGLKQHIFIALEFCRSMFNRISLLELRFQQGHITSEALVENPVFYIKFFFSNYLHSLAHSPPSSIIRPAMLHIYNHYPESYLPGVRAKKECFYWFGQKVPSFFPIRWSSNT